VIIGGVVRIIPDTPALGDPNSFQPNLSLRYPVLRATGLPTA
jgi:hypothetical protein